MELHCWGCPSAGLMQAAGACCALSQGCQAGVARHCSALLTTGVALAWISWVSWRPSPFASPAQHALPVAGLLRCPVTSTAEDGPLFQGRIAPACWLPDMWFSGGWGFHCSSIQHSTCAACRKQRASMHGPCGSRVQQTLRLRPLYTGTRNKKSVLPAGASVLACMAPTCWPFGTRRLRSSRPSPRLGQASLRRG